MFNQFKEIVFDALAGFGRNDGMASAGNMAFLAMMSLFPFIFCLISLSGMAGQSERGLEAVGLALQFLPKEISSVLQGPISSVIKNARADLLTGSFIMAIWVAANGVEAARHTVIKAFGKEYARTMWARRLESLMVVFFGAGLVLLTMSILVVGPAVFKVAISYFPSVENSLFDEVWKFLQLFVSPLLLLLGVYGLYLALTPHKIIRPYRLPGAIFTLIVFLAVAKGLSTYLSYAGDYDVTYGSLAGVVITQLFCYVVSVGFILGAELNAAWSRHKGLQIKGLDELMFSTDKTTPTVNKDDTTAPHSGE